MIVKGEIPRFSTIGEDELSLASRALLAGPLSGFLGGELHGGEWVQKLERAWEKKFEAKHSIACNSATSGLLAACASVLVGPQYEVAVPALTMSATAAAPAFLGANIRFTDVEEDYYCISKDYGVPDVIITTNLFGQPTATSRLTNLAGVSTIEDNAQAIFATNNKKYAGTVADIGVFSLNVHKHLQCGEGGVCVTDDDELAHKMRLFINHGEMAGWAGLNLRMTEVTAAIAVAQLAKGPEIVLDRVQQARRILDSIGEIDGLIHPAVRKGCTHVYYALAFRVKKDRERIVKELNAEGVPVKAGYVEPLYRLPAFAKFKYECPIAERLHDHELMLFENCAYSPTDEQIDQIGQAFRKVMT